MMFHNFVMLVGLLGPSGCVMIGAGVAIQQLNSWAHFYGGLRVSARSHLRWCGTGAGVAPGQRGYSGGWCGHSADEPQPGISDCFAGSGSGEQVRTERVLSCVESFIPGCKRTRDEQGS